METITLPKTKYETLKKQALLYKEIFRFLPEKIFGAELYSRRRLQEFKREDRLDRKTRACLNKILKPL